MSWERFLQMRARFDRFVYETFAIMEEEDAICCVFSYSLRGVDSLIALEHRVRFAGRPFQGVSPQNPLFERAVFLLGLAEAVSYWKTACPYFLEVKAGALVPEEIGFWERLYTRGLGEFWWLNGIYGKIAETEYIRILPVSSVPASLPPHPKLSGCLIPVGGGKDSVVTLELLKRLGGGPETSDCFLLSARKASYDTALLAGFDSGRQVEAFRLFDPQLFVMNREGYLNGHVPYSAILGFTVVAAALLRGRRHIVLSNEGSANEPTVPGTWVNHQYSKSLEFETAFSSYLRCHLTPAVTYFSLLRPWSEARIAMEFARYPLYHAAYRSCNRGARENRWCCACPKCLFVFLLVAAHAGVPATTAMFGENLLRKEELTGLLDELAGFVPVKPFECVGTVAETRWSLTRILADPALPQDADSWSLLQHFKKQQGDRPPPPFRLEEPELGFLIPDPFRSLVISESGEAMECIRKRLEGREIGILGFGLEGRSTLAFLQDMFPGRPFSVADQDEHRLTDLPEGIRAFSGEAYAEALVSCDLVFKAPGIPWMSLEHLFRPDQMTSQTDLFLAVLGNRTIGITGTKGKSTTAALVHAALTACGHEAAMVGNMGIPALDAVRSDHPGRVYVCELSSHMLETIRHAPRGAVYLNLHEDHLDHYHSFDAYASAKENLLRLQAAEGFAVVGENVAARSEGLGKAAHFRVELDGDGKMRLGEAQYASIEADAFTARVLPAHHNLVNMRMAFLAVHLWETRESGCPLGLAAPALRSEVLHAMNTFAGLPHRLKQVAEVQGIRFWDDSISTIPEACMLAVEAIGDVDTLLFGGLDRGIRYDALEAFLASGRVRNLIGLPDTGHRILDRIEAGTGFPPDVQVFRATDMGNAVELAFAVTRPGRSCLLSPAAASYGWYRNFEERGDHFTQLVRGGCS